MIKTKPLLFIIAFATLTFCNSKKEDKSPEIQESIQRGSEVYNDFCMACHLPNGQGVHAHFRLWRNRII